LRAILTVNERMMRLRHPVQLSGADDVGVWARERGMGAIDTRAQYRCRSCG